MPTILIIIKGTNKIISSKAQINTPNKFSKEGFAMTKTLEGMKSTSNLIQNTKKKQKLSRNKLKSSLSSRNNLNKLQATGSRIENKNSKYLTKSKQSMFCSITQKHF